MHIQAANSIFSILMIYKLLGPFMGNLLHDAPTYDLQLYFEFIHNFYDHKGRNFASCEMMGAWIDLKERKLIGLPEVLFENLSSLSKTDDFKVLTKEDTRKFGKKPKDLV